jgi:transposase
MLQLSGMNRKNKYCHHSHISERKFREIVRYFALDLEASKIAELTGVSRNSVNRILNALRERVSRWCELESPLSCSKNMRSSEFCDEESGVQGQEIQEETGQGDASRVPVLGIVKDNGKIFTRILPEVSRKGLQAIVQGKASLDSLISGNGSCVYNGLVDFGWKKLYRLYEAGDEHAPNKPAINSIENFWGAAKMRLAKFRGLRRETLYLHLKETEFRFNNRNEDLYELLLKMLRKEPLNLSTAASEK